MQVVFNIIIIIIKRILLDKLPIKMQDENYIPDEDLRLGLLFGEQRDDDL
jgi:hypothetical protein